MKIVLIGADGQLGSELVRVLKNEDLVLLYYPDFDVTRWEQVRDVLRRERAEVVINTAAYHRVDECEDNAGLAFAVNALAVRDLAVVCREMDSVLVHFSTDYVFDGRKGAPYWEEDCPRPLNVYAASKLSGEILLRNSWERHIIVRTCGLYGLTGAQGGKGTNFIESILAAEHEGRPLRIVADQRVTPTSTAELARRIAELIRTPHFGLFHMTCEGDCTWFEFAREVFRLLGKDTDLEPVSSAEFPTKAKRPMYSVLENKRAKDLGLSGFLHWKDALEEYLTAKGRMS